MSVDNINGRVSYFYQSRRTPYRPDAEGGATNNPGSGDAGQKASPTTGSIGTSPLIQDVLKRLELAMQLQSGTDGDDTIEGWTSSLVDAGSGNDTISVWSDSIVDAGDGDDKIYSWSGSRVHGGNGNDQIDAWSDSHVDGGSGDDDINAWSNSHVDGGDGDDTIQAWSETTVNGGKGDDVIKAWSDSRVDGGEGDDWIDTHTHSVVSGGKGADQIRVGLGSTVRFNAGDGQDSLTVLGDTVLELGSGLKAEDMTVSAEDGETVIRFAGNPDDTITIRGKSTLTVKFADGGTTDLDIHHMPSLPPLQQLPDAAMSEMLSRVLAQNSAGAGS
ncbi:hypothetical protein [Rhizobium terrae]|uniref:hypothetical protein n=1 Tax=Rhizobium terrae TaxID=2171756 RepID=UPI000E3C6ED9|nr:hypothetical protein [Rhizobium terrae]